MSAVQPTNNSPATVNAEAAADVNKPAAANLEVSAAAESANDADSATGNKTNGSGTDAADKAPTNEVKKIADEIVGKMGDIQDHKDQLMAYGIPFNTVNVLVEMSVHGRSEEQISMRNAAVETSRKQHGASALSPEVLDKTLDALVALEKDLGLVRRLGQQQGLNMTAMNYLTMLIRLSPGDGGVKVVNTLLAYAIACDIPLDKVKEMSEEINSEPVSVLPNIPRESNDDLQSESRKQLLIDVCVGLLMAIGALALLT